MMDCHFRFIHQMPLGGFCFQVSKTFSSNSQLPSVPCSSLHGDAECGRVFVGFALAVGQSSHTWTGNAKFTKVKVLLLTCTGQV